MNKIAIFDIESVLLDGEFLPKLAERFGKGKEVHHITLRGLRGEIKWEDGLKERIELLKGVSEDEAKKVADSMPYMKGAKEVCSELKKKGYVIIAVTGGFTIFSERVKRELGIDYLFSNELIFNDGALHDIAPLKVKSDRVEGIEELLVSLGAKKENVVAVVDGANDMKLFRYAGTRIAFNGQPIVREVANVIVNSKDLRDIMKYIVF
ncbi:MAG: phosphoserine phosphatase SerB [Candidatus Hadarchaeales archaeon]